MFMINVHFIMYNLYEPMKIKYVHKTMASIASLEKIEIIISQKFMPSKARLTFLKKMIILGPKTAILGPQFCRILVLGPHFWWSGGTQTPRPPWIRPWGALAGTFQQKCMREQKNWVPLGVGDAGDAPWTRHWKHTYHF